MTPPEAQLGEFDHNNTLWSTTPPAGAPYFLVDKLPPTGPYLLTGPEGRHAADVRRMRVSEQMVLTDGAGRWAAATVTSRDRNSRDRHQLQVEVGPARFQPSPPVRVVLVQAIPKGEHGDLAVDLATEAGVDEIVPWQAARCMARWEDEKVATGPARWQSIAREAAKQARRTHVPPVHPPATTADVARLIGAAAGAVLLHESESARLTEVVLPVAGDLLLVVGPEGGITPLELDTLSTAGARSARLGPEVLRSSAAAAVALGALGVLTSRWAAAVTADETTDGRIQ